jgi:hypothetical protein
MDAIIALLGLVLSYFLLLRPYWLSLRERVQDEARETYRAFQLRMVRRYYPEMQQLSFWEMEQMYDIGEAFHRIGGSRALYSADAGQHEPDYLS